MILKNTFQHITSRELVLHGFFMPLFNPESVLDFVAKLNYSIKARAHGLFLKKEYFRILNLKKGVSSWF